MRSDLSVERAVATLIVGLSLWGSPAWSQTPTTVVPPKNKYKPADDVRLGRAAVDQIRKQVPMLKDEPLHGYLNRLGQRLVAVIPAGLQQKEFVYTFDVADMAEINAFALPGGPMFVHRGIMAVAKNEGELAGVMAHELSHVILRHGTAQQTKAEKFQIGALAGQVLGAVVGGAVGGIIAQGSNFGVSAYFMKFSREYETQADIMGAQIMSRAGYDPRDMASMFRTLEKEAGASGPQWLSDHPNPGNRAAYITKEATALKVEAGRRPDDSGFGPMQARLKTLPPPPTPPKAAASSAAASSSAPTGGGSASRPLELPSDQLRTYTAGNAVKIGVPANWESRADGGVAMFAPPGAFVQKNGGTSFTHGVEAGTTVGQTQDLQRDTQALVQSLTRSNPQLRPSGVYQPTIVGGRSGIATSMGNVSDITGQLEYVTVFTTRMRDGGLFYLIGVAPQSEAAVYTDTFARVRQSVRLTD